MAAEYEPVEGALSAGACPQPGRVVADAALTACKTDIALRFLNRMSWGPDHI